MQTPTLEQARFVRRGFGIAEVVLVAGVIAAFAAAVLVIAASVFSNTTSTPPPPLVPMLVFFGLLSVALALYRWLKGNIGPSFRLSIRGTDLVVAADRAPETIISAKAIQSLRYGYALGRSFVNPFAPTPDIIHTIIEIEGGELAAPLRLIAIGQKVSQIIDRMGEVERGNPAIDVHVLPATFGSAF